MEKHVAVGRILKAHGVKGGLLVKPLTDSASRGRTLKDVVLMRGPEVRTAKVKSVRVVEGRWVVHLEGVATRDEAELLRGCVIGVHPEESPPLPDGRWYVHDLVGREVVTDDGIYLGEIADVIATGSNDVFVISGPEGELLFPALKNLVVECKQGERFIKVRMPPGLLEACLAKEA